ncbi:MAG: glycoside hydrolase family 3 N-terminal domain-containing protein [Culicoidibacterales bacterium]
MKHQELVALANSLTIEEKVGQLIQLAPFFFSAKSQGEITGPMSEVGVSETNIQQAGSVLGISGAEEMIEIQTTYMEKSVKKIPLMIMADIIHGYRTIFPIPLGLGSSWDMELAEKTAQVAAKEAAAGGVHVTFSPMVDLVRDPRWGRVMESTGEDVYLNQEYAKAFVKGYQGDSLEDMERVAACVKHFAAYGAPEGGRDYNTVDMSERMMREQYLPAYKAAIDAGCKMIMTAFNTVDMVPASGNEWLMRDILRDEWNFEGIVISDWGAVKELIPHGVASDEREAAAKAMTAGVDIEMMTGCYANHIEQLITEGTVSESLLDEAVLRILELKNELGLFENPFRGADIEKEQQLILCDEHRKVAREAAQKSMVLLQNENDTLPFSKDYKKIAIIGPFADNGAILGGWSWQGKFEETVTLVQGIKNKMPDSEIIVAQGADIETMTTEQYEEAIAVAKQADIVILALGEHHDMSGEGGSRTVITLPGKQLELATAIGQLNKPTVTVLFNGRPLEIRALTAVTPAILEAWYPGTEGGNAIADILFGDVNPSGRLTMSFPYTVGQIPVYYNYFNTGRPKFTEDHDNRYCSHYLDSPNAPLYGFGYGLSYTQFDYSPLSCEEVVVTKEKPITVSVSVTNTGKHAGTETVQLYIRDMAGSVVRPMKELKGFEKITLEVNETKQVTFMITEEMLRFQTLKNGFNSEVGSFEVMIGANVDSVQIIQCKLV